MRPISQIVERVRDSQCEVQISYGGQKVDARNVLGLMTLGAAQGSELLLEVGGEDAEQMLQQLEQMFLTNFKEETKEARTKF